MSQTVAALKFQILADAAQFVDGIALTKKELKDAARAADGARSSFQKFTDEQARMARLVAGGGLSADAAAAHLAKLVPMAELVPERKKLKLDDLLAKGFDRNALGRSGVDKLAKDVTDMNKAFGVAPLAINPTTAAMTAFAVGTTTAAAAVGGLAATVAKRMEAIDALGDSAKRLGVSISALSTLRGAAFLGDTDPALVETMMQKMLVNAGKGGEVFDNLGLSLEELKSGDAASMFIKIADAINSIPPSKADQMAAIAEIFGKSGPEGAEFVSRVRELSDEVRRAGAVVSDELGVKVDVADEGFKRLALSAERFSNVMVAVSAGPVGKTLDALSKIAETSAFERAAGLGVSALGGAANIPGAGILGGTLTAEMLAERAKLQAAAVADGVKGSREAIEKAMEEDAGGGLLDGGPGDNIWAKAAEDRAIALAEFRMDQDRHEMAERERLAKESHHRELERLHELTAERDARFEKDRREAEEGRRILDALRTPGEAINARLDEDLAALGKSGMLDDAARGKLLARAAREMIGLEGGAFGVPSATKGSAAARTAVLEAEHAAKQQRALDEMVKRLAEIRDKKPVEFVLVAGP